VRLDIGVSYKTVLILLNIKWYTTPGLYPANMIESSEMCQQREHSAVLTVHCLVYCEAHLLWNMEGHLHLIPTLLVIVSHC
jgi:hypothetical protein